MQTEEFYRNIQDKIERAEFSPDFLEWNQESVWERIEQKKKTEKPKTIFVWWRSSIAASIALLMLVGGYFFIKNQDKSSVVSINEEQKVLIEPIEKPAVMPSTRLNIASVKSVSDNTRINSKSTEYLTHNTEIERELVDLENVQYQYIVEAAESGIEPTKHPLPATTIIAADSPTEKIVETPKIETELADSQPFVAAPKFERTVILDIPDTEEYNRYQRIEKKNFVSRLFKQVGKFNTEGKVDWNELNVKPNRIWAYVRESMKNEKREAK